MTLLRLLVACCSSFFVSGCSGEEAESIPNAGTGGWGGSVTDQGGGSELVGGSDSGDSGGGSGGQGEDGIGGGGGGSECPWEVDPDRYPWSDRHPPCVYCLGACADIFEGPQGPEFLDCLTGCEDDIDCIWDCWDQYPEAYKRFNHWYICISKNCNSLPPARCCDWGWKEKTECNHCWHAACDCIPMDTWNEFVGCLQACDTNDDPCEEACYDTHTEAADLIRCVYDECGIPCSFLFDP
ncbi:MAG: hypothetical protein FWD57_08350 [Polyangiaceae bacterium]|nr:hypothetical protein [Polyangiaceae bacterium]